jgi:hypothetical protein
VAHLPGRLHGKSALALFSIPGNPEPPIIFQYLIDAAAAQISEKMGAI